MAREQEIEFSTIAAEVLAEAKSKKGPDMGTVAKAILCCGLSLEHVADKLGSVAFQLKYLGNGDAATPMGALEALGLVIKESVGSMASAISEVGNSMDRQE